MKYVIIAVIFVLFLIFFAWGVVAEMTPYTDQFGEEDDWDPEWDEED